MSDPIASALSVPANTAGWSLVDELALEQTSTGFARNISPFWGIEGRIFGGYTASLTLAAAARKTGFPALLSSHVLFLSAVRSGPVQIEIETLSQSRTAAAVRIVLKQAGVTALSAQAWLGIELSKTDGSGERLQPNPETCAPIRFRAGLMPVMDILDERQVDYPITNADFQSGPPFVDIWIRPKYVEEVDPLVSQLFDVMAFDAHMLDPTRRARTTNRIETTSMDIGVIWYSVLQAQAWRRVSAESSPSGHGFASTSGLLLDEFGAVCARATQQGRVWHPRPAAS